MRDIEIPDPPIRLGQLLKLSGVAGSGAEAKALLAQGQITVNGEPELRRGRQLRTGDVVEAAGEQVRVVEPPGESNEQSPGESNEQPPGEGNEQPPGEG